MINYISIKNFAIIENVEVSFHSGLNIITGETGSGKSIVVEAMSLALGARADSSMVRSNQEKATIQMVCDYMHTEYVVTREISSTGKNLCKINGDIVSLGELQEFTKKVADIHGQYDNQSLLNPASHIMLVDTYEKDSINPCKERVSELYKKYVETYNKIVELQQGSSNSLKSKEIMEFEIKEISEANLIIGEDIELKEKLIEEQNKETIATGFANVYNLCNTDDDSVSASINKIVKGLKDLKPLSKDAGNLEDDFLDIYYRLEDLINRVRVQAQKSTYDSSDIEIIMDRLNLIDSLSRKYGGSIENVLNYSDTLKKKLITLSNIDVEINSLQIELERTGELLKNETNRLTYLRTTSANSLEEKIQKELLDLNLSNAVVRLEVTTSKKYTANGVDKVEFLISTNLGENLKPLNKIVSGGEMSRIMLAFKNVIGEYDNIQTMIFDEIDSGISGIAASTVASKLKEIAQKHQIIAITHLPQIAAVGNHNFKIDKHNDGEKTYTTVEYLTESEKTHEIARLLSGNSITDIALQNAKQLIDQ
ncbi:MAG: DNA repair protein RecN [Anaerovoracaceae bacterium]